MPDKKTGRFEMRVSPEWMERVRTAAERTSLDIGIGISAADWLIMVSEGKVKPLEDQSKRRPRKVES